MRIDIYIDDQKEPIDSILPPQKFDLDTNKLEDGKHEITFKATGKSGITSVRVVPFSVQNGPAIDLHGIRENEKLNGNISILANAYSVTRGDEFEPILMETPAPVPTWAWVLLLIIFAWGAGYVSLEVHNRINNPPIEISQSSQSSNTGSINMEDTASVETIQDSNEPSANSSQSSWAKLGQQVYGNNCGSCHQATGMGLPSVFPPLKNNPAVLNDDPSTHINAVLKGVSGKIIDGVAYASPMPPFGSALSDEEVAAVVNHERTQWGNNGELVTVEDVAKLR